MGRGRKMGKEKIRDLHSLSRLGPLCGPPLFTGPRSERQGHPCQHWSGTDDNLWQPTRKFWVPTWFCPLAWGFREAEQGISTGTEATRDQPGTVEGKGWL